MILVHFTFPETSCDARNAVKCDFDRYFDLKFFEKCSKYVKNDTFKTTEHFMRNTSMIHLFCIYLYFKSLMLYSFLFLEIK